MRAILIAATVTLWLIVALQIVGLQDTPRHAICGTAGYPASDMGLAQCADHFGWSCGDPYTDPLRPSCP